MAAGNVTLFLDSSDSGYYWRLFMLRGSSFCGFRWVIPVPDVFRAGHFGPHRPIWTRGCLWSSQFLTCHIDVGQVEQGEQMLRILRQAAIPDLSVAPQVFDDPKGMFPVCVRETARAGRDPCACAVALFAERNVRAVETLTPAGLAKHPPFHVVFSACSFRV